MGIFGGIWAKYPQIPLFIEEIAVFGPYLGVYGPNTAIWAIFGGIWPDMALLAVYGPNTAISPKYPYFGQIPLFRLFRPNTAISAKYALLSRIRAYMVNWGQIWGKSPTTASIELAGAKRGDSGDIPYFTLFGDSGQIWWCTPNTMCAPGYHPVRACAHIGQIQAKYRPK